MSGALRPTIAQLKLALQRVVGREQAALELRWMKQAIGRPPVGASISSLQDMLARRINGEPLQYILGSQPFGPLSLIARAPVLIPRPETEDWTIRLSERLTPSRECPISILDLCTGSGCIPLLLCHILPPGSTHAVGIDVSEEAIQLARDNAAACSIAIPADGPVSRDGYVRWNLNTFTPLLANIRDPAFVTACRLQPPFDVVTSNPPYISKQEYDNLPPSVKDYEDPRALLGDPEHGLQSDRTARGLSFYHTIAELLGNRDAKILKSDGMVAFEVGEGQASDVAQVLEQKARIRNIEIWRDLWGKERVVVGQGQSL